MLLGTACILQKKGNIFRKEHIYICSYLEHNIVHLVPRKAHISASFVYMASTLLLGTWPVSCMVKKDNMCHKLLLDGDKKRMHMLKNENLMLPI